MRRVFADGRGNLWIATLHGLSLFHEATNTFEHFLHNPLDASSLSDDFINFIFQDSRQAIWIGTLGGGLNRLLPGKEAGGRPAAFRVFKMKPGPANSIASDAVLSILEDRQGILWLGTGSGLDRFDPASQTFRNYSERNGLPNNFIYGIEEDGAGKLWLSSNRGLCRFDPQSGAVDSYGLSHGVQDLEFNGGAFLKSRDGTMFFGGVNGFNMFDPARIKDNPVIPPLVITEVKVYPRNYSLAGRYHARAAAGPVVSRHPAHHRIRRLELQRSRRQPLCLPHRRFERGLDRPRPCPQPDAHQPETRGIRVSRQGLQQRRHLE